MRRSDDRRFRAIQTDLAGAALAFVFEFLIVVGLAAAALIVAAVVTAVN